MQAVPSIPDHLVPRWQRFLAGLAQSTGAAALRVMPEGGDNALAEYLTVHNKPSPFASAPALRLPLQSPPRAWLELFTAPGTILSPGAEAISAVLCEVMAEDLNAAPAKPAAPKITNHFHLLMEAAHDSIFLHDAEGRILDVNARACQSHGYSRDELLRLNTDVLSVHGQRHKDSAYRHLTPGETAKFTTQALRKDGTLFPIEMQISCHELGGSKVYLCLLRDVSDQIEARQRLVQLNAELEQRVQERTQALNTTSRQLQAIMDTLPDGITLTDHEGKILHANPAARVLLGLSPDHLGKKLGGDGLRALADGESLTVKERRPDPSGRERTLLTTHSPRRDERGVIDGLVSLYRDITDAEMIERRVRHSVDSLERAEKLARIGSWTLNLETGAFDTSAMMYELNGVSPDREITVEDLARMMPEADFNRVGAGIAACAADGTPYTVDVTHYIPGGGQFQAEIRGRAMRDDDGKIFAITGTVQDVSARIAMQEQLSAIADSLPNGAIYRIEFLDPDVGEDGYALSRATMQFSYVSAGVQKLIGLSAEELTANPERLLAAIHPDDLETFLAGSRTASAEHRNFEFDFRLIRPDGKLIWLQVRSAPRLVGGKRVWDGILLDVTAAYETAEALRHAKDEAEAAERAKSGFLATMSHEIRTPMNSVIGMTRLALQTDLSARQRNYLEKIDTSARALLGLINDILDFSRIEAGGLQLETTEFALDSVLETVSNATSLKAEEKGLEVIYSVTPEVPWLLRGDPLRLGQVLINLVGNAIKFTDRGEVKVTVERSADQQNLRFEVRDTGIGMDAAQLAELFRPFSQTSSRTARYYGGTGLGLSISKQLVQLMGGQIDVTSQPGFGSCFSFIVPSIDPVERSSRVSSIFQGRRALVVDDSATARNALCEMVQSLGFSAEAVGSGSEALSRLRQRTLLDEPIDLVLMDWRMPGMDGVEAARQIRQDRILRKIPAVLMVTAHAREEVLRYVDQLQLQGLLIKPVTESMMLDAVQPIFSRRGTGHGSEASAIVPIDVPEILKGKSVLVVDDNQFNLEVASDFLELAAMKVTTAVSGQEALDALRQTSFDVVLMDMQMPLMDGLETTRRIRLNPALRDLPVIALTAQARLEDREATQQVGMSDHLTKPIDENVMFATLARALSAQPAQPKADRPAEPAPSAGIDLAHMLTRARGDHARVMRTLDMFLRDFSVCPDEVRHGLETGARASIAAVAHRIRGTAGYLGANRLKDFGDHLEIAASDPEQPEITELTGAFLAELESVLDACRAAREGQPG